MKAEIELKFKATLTALIVSIVSGGQASANTISISADELVKFEYLLKTVDIPIHDVILANLNAGKIVVENGQVRILKSNFDLLNEAQKIDEKNARKSTICQRSGSGD